jgi:hypothetical protein
VNSPWPLRRLDSLVGEDAPDLYLELRPLSDHEGPPPDLLPEEGYLEEAVHPEELRQGLTAGLVRLDAGLRDVLGLLRVADCDVVSLLGEPPVEGCDACGGLHRHSFHPVGFEEGGYLLVGHSPLGQLLSVWSQDCGVCVFLVDIQSRNNSAHRMA